MIRAHALPLQRTAWRHGPTLDSQFVMMKSLSKFTLIAAGIFLSLSISAAVAGVDWKPLDFIDGEAFLIDETSVADEGFTKRATVAAQPTDKRKIDNMPFGSALYDVQVDCTRRMLSVKNGEIREQPLPDPNAVSHPARGLFHEIFPASVENRLINFLCWGG